MTNKQRTLIIGGIVALTLLAVVVPQTIFTVDERQLAVVVRFGDPIASYGEKDTGMHFKVDEVSADKAYASFDNVLAVDEVGGTPFIAVKSDITGETGPDLFRQMVGFFRYREAEFRRHYHKRSNIETVFSMVKRKFGGAVRGKHRVVQENELLCKFILHNFRVCVMGIYDLGEDPQFWKGVA